MFAYVSRVLERLVGLRLTRIAAENAARLADVSPEIRNTVECARQFTMTSPERLVALCMAVEHVVASGVQGAFVECGVWRGGSSMAAALTYRRLGREDVDVFLFDTFEGMPKPGEEDVLQSTGARAADILASSDRSSGVWAYSPEQDVRRNLASTGYPAERLHFVKGLVEQTIPARAPDQIAILRLDTDWYESTKHELTHLFPRLSSNGILIVDDYGHWAGARKAVDEYFLAHGLRPFLARVDYTGRLLVKS